MDITVTVRMLHIEFKKLVVLCEGQKPFQVTGSEVVRTSYARYAKKRFKINTETFCVKLKITIVLMKIKYRLRSLETNI